MYYCVELVCLEELVVVLDWFVNWYYYIGEINFFVLVLEYIYGIGKVYVFVDGNKCIVF